jgi:predicted ATPase
MALLLERWAQVKEGTGHVVLLSGEAGIGKSRLVQVLKDHAAGETHTRLECRCSPYHQNSALYPLIDLLHRTLRWQEHEGSAGRLEKLEHALGQYRLPLDETVPLLAALLSLPLPDGRYPALTLTPQRQKQKTLEVILTMVLELTERQPVLFIVEDLHWIDPSTLEFLGLLIEQGPTVRLLILLTYRQTFQPPWIGRAYITPLTLTRLPAAQVEAMVARLTHGKPLPTEVLHHVVTKTDGVPLFVEELTKMLLESGLLTEADNRYMLVGPLPSLAIPATLHDSLMARLDRLAAVKAVAQLGATLGRQFSYHLLQAVSPMDEPTLQHGLQQLVDAELLYCRGVPPQATYLFKHALIQEAAYQSLLKSTRQQYHQRIAQVLTEQFSETVQTQPELLAYHYTEAGLSAQAIIYWQRAGQRAIDRSAYAEAIGHLNKGLEVLDSLPDTPERAQRELALQTALGLVLTATRGHGAPEVGRTYARARALCQQVDDPRQLSATLAGLRRFYLVRGELQTAREIGEQLLRLAQRQQDTALLLWGHFGLGAPLYHLGELAAARAHLEQGIALYDPVQHRGLAFHYGADLGVICRSWAAMVLWHLGYPEQSLQRSREALTLARELAHPFSLFMGQTFAINVHQFRRELQATLEHIEACETLGVEHGFQTGGGAAAVIRGWVLVEQGQVEEGILQMRQGLALGLEGTRAYQLILLAGAYGRAGQITAALATLEEALALVYKNAERLFEAEIYRLKGELLLKQSSDHFAEAETCFHQALAIACHQQAKSLELRAATSLARLWQHQGKRAEARELLAPIYDWFTEGFDTADLCDARALLEELA